MNDDQDRKSTHDDLEPARPFELDLTDGEDVSEIQFEDGQLNDINYGF